MPLHDREESASYETLGRVFGALAAVAHDASEMTAGYFVRYPVLASCGFSGGLGFGFRERCTSSQPERWPAISTDRRFRLFQHGTTRGPYPCRLPPPDRLQEPSRASRLRPGRWRPYVSGAVAVLHSGRVLGGGDHHEMAVPLPCGCTVRFLIWVDDLGDCPR